MSARFLILKIISGFFVMLFNCIISKMVLAQEQVQVASGTQLAESAFGKKEGKKDVSEKGVFESSFISDKDKGDLPTFIKSSTLSLDAKKRVFTYTGQVEVHRGDLVVTSDVMIGNYDKDNRLKSILCKKNVVITRGDTLRATADNASYNLKTAIIELTENPELYHKGNALTADKVTIYLDEDRSEAEGDVRVKVTKPTESKEEDAAKTANALEGLVAKEEDGI